MQNYNGIRPAGQHSEGARANAARFADVFKGMFHWQKKKMPSPGAMNYAFESLGLVEYEYNGAGINTRKTLYKTSPQVYVPINAVVTNGLGGLATGQIALTGLFDPKTNTFAGVPIGP